MADSAQKAFTGTGSTAPAMMKEGIARISGTFVASAIIEVDAIGDGTWAPATDQYGTVLAFTAPASVHIDNGTVCLTRITCSAYTSGTMNAALRC